MWNIIRNTHIVHTRLHHSTLLSSSSFLSSSLLYSIPPSHPPHSSLLTQHVKNINTTQQQHTDPPRHSNSRFFQIATTTLTALSVIYVAYSVTNSQHDPEARYRKVEEEDTNDFTPHNRPPKIDIPSIVDNKASVPPPSSPSTSSLPPLVDDATIPSDVESTAEPSSIHPDHTSCRACRPGQGVDLNGNFKYSESNEFFGESDTSSTSNSSSSSSSSSSPSSSSSSSPCPPCYAYSHSVCPLNRAEVGRAGWGFLHTLTAYYPDHPTSQQRHDMEQFITLYMKLYPCGYCADRSMEQLEREPIQRYSHSQQALAIWMCHAHNEVNERLGKPIFDCDYVNERWRDGPPTGECQ